MRNRVFELIRSGEFIELYSNLDNGSKEYVTIRFLYCGICGGDFSSYLGRRNEYPISLGHEFIAKIIKSDEDTTHLKKGDLVVSDLNYRCGDCEYCNINQSYLCDKNDLQLFSNRAFAKYASIHYSYLLEVNKLANNILSCTLIEPLSCILHACELLHINPNDDVLIVGIGNIGTLFAFYFREVLRIPNVFVYDSIAEKQQNVVTKFGCFHHYGRKKFKLVIEATNTVNGLNYAIGACEKAGKLCSISHLYGLNITNCIEEIQKKEIVCIFPLRNGEFKNLKEASAIIYKYWKTEYNSLFYVANINSINAIFEEKQKNKFNKQIIKCY